MKPKSILRLLFIASLIIPAACDVKDPIYNTAHPEHGAVTLSTDWSGRGEGLAVPESYTVETGGYTATLSGATTGSTIFSTRARTACASITRRSMSPWMGPPSP